MAFVGTRRALLSSTAKKPAASWNFAGQGQLPSWLSFSRASNATNFNSSGNLVYAPNNQIRNSAASGASAGTPGTAPTNWTVFGSTVDGLTTSISTVNNADITYLGVRFVGTISAGGIGSAIEFETNSAIAAVLGQNVIDTAYIYYSGTNISTAFSGVTLSLAQFTSGGASAGTQFGTELKTSITTSPQRFSAPFSVNNSGGTTAFARPRVRVVTGAASTAVDITIFFGLPQLSLVTAAQSSIPDMPATTSSAYYGPRFDYDPSTLAARGLLLEGARTNSIRNNTMVGAVAGTPGTMPTNWSTFTGVTGLTRTIVGTGTENGISYIDIQISGTPGSSGSYSIIFESATAMAALTGQFWNFSTFVKLAGGALTNVGTPGLSAQENTSGGSFVAGGTSVVSFTPTSSGLATQRYSGNRTLSGGGTVAAVQDYLTFGVTSGQAINVTLRIGLPQAEQLLSATQTASSPIPTTGSALTRSADIATITGVPATILASAQGTMLVETVQPVNGNGLNSRLIGSTTGLPLGIGSAGIVLTQNGTTYLFPSSASTWTTGARGVAGWDPTGRSVVSTGVALVSDTNIGIGSGTFYLGSNNSASTADGWYTRAAFYNSRLSNATLAQKVVLGAPL